MHYQTHVTYHPQPLLHNRPGPSHRFQARLHQSGDDSPTVQRQGECTSSTEAWFSPRTLLASSSASMSSPKSFVQTSLILVWFSWVWTVWPSCRTNCSIPWRLTVFCQSHRRNSRRVSESLPNVTLNDLHHDGRAQGKIENSKVSILHVCP